MGDHTDYNEGLVLPIAIGLECVVAARPRADREVSLRSLDEVEDDWTRYVDAGREVLSPPRGVEGLLASSVSPGSGLSSSAALEVAVALALGSGDLSPVELARAATRAGPGRCGDRRRALRRAPDARRERVRGASRSVRASRGRARAPLSARRDPRSGARRTARAARRHRERACGADRRRAGGRGPSARRRAHAREPREPPRRLSRFDTGAGRDRRGTRVRGRVRRAADERRLRGCAVAIAPRVAVADVMRAFPTTWLVDAADGAGPLQPWSER